MLYLGMIAQSHMLYLGMITQSHKLYLGMITQRSSIQAQDAHPRAKITKAN